MLILPVYLSHDLCKAHSLIDARDGASQVGYKGHGAIIDRFHITEVGVGIHFLC